MRVGQMAVETKMSRPGNIYRLLHRRRFLTTRAPYASATQKLVLVFDISNTYSGAACAFLDPDQAPQINSVAEGVFPPPNNYQNWRQVPRQAKRWILPQSLRCSGPTLFPRTGSYIFGRYG